MATRAEADAGPVPKLREGIDITKLRLSLEEGFVASRIDGRTTIADIAHLVGKPRPETEKILDRLAKAGIILIDSGDTKKRKETSDLDAGSAATDYGKYIFPPALMSESCDLEPQERKRIIWFYD